MAGPFKMKGPMFFKSAMKKYSASKQVNPKAKRGEGNPIEQTKTKSPQAAEMDYINPVESPVEQGTVAGRPTPEYRPTAAGEEQMLAAEGAIKKKSPSKQGPTADQIKAKYGSYKDYKKAVKKGHVKKGALQKSPTKQGKWGMYNPDMNPKPLPGQPGSNQLGAATPQKSPTKQRPAKTEAGSGGQTTINKEEAKAARAAQGGPIEQKSPTKQGGGGAGGYRGPKEEEEKWVNKKNPVGPKGEN